MFARLVGTVSRLVERMAKSKEQEEDGSSENEQLDTGEFEKPELLSSSVECGDEKLPRFLDKQKSKLLQFRDSLLDLMTGVSRDTSIRGRKIARRPHSECIRRMRVATRTIAISH
jgi:hypothetical protein